MAAAVLLPAVIFLSIYFNTDISTYETGAQITEIVPGVKKAQLVLSNGERIELSDTLLDITEDTEKVKIFNDKSTLSYTAEEEVPQELRFNTLVVGRGEEYKLLLADGTKVWLNSESTLRYPVQFMGDKREVELIGEAFFEVAHNENIPFHVNSSEMSIKVLGTSFNVSVYPDDENVHTTLVEGSVKVSSKVGVGNEKILRPDQQFIYNRSNNNVQVNDVDTEFYSAWKDGAFSFDNESLFSIMRKLERWYNIRVFYHGQDIQKLRFTGELKRFGTCNDVLEVISKTTHIKYEIKGERNVVISK